MGHLLELRKRLMVAVFAIFFTTVLSLIFYQEIFVVLRKPLEDVNQKFREVEEYKALLLPLGLAPGESVIQPISTKPLGLMMILMKVAFGAGLILSSPIVLYELWGFVAPGLKTSERGAIRPVLWVGVLCFIAGASFCYFIVFPVTLEFLVWLDVVLGFRPSYTPDEYIGILLTFMLLFGAVFEMPLVAAVLARLGILPPGLLTKYWRATIVACFVVGSILSPGSDIMSMILMSGSLVVLYLISIVAVHVFYPRGKS